MTTPSKTVPLSDLSLLTRTGFRIAWDNNFDFTLPGGTDTYSMFVCEKLPYQP